MNWRNGEREDGIARPTREEIEGLCLVHVASVEARSVADIADALGLSRDVAPAIEEAVVPLIQSGQLEVIDGCVRATNSGQDWLLARLSELEVR